MKRMKRYFPFTGLLLVIVLIPFITSCEKSSENPLKVSDVKHTGCKTFKSLVDKNQDCIEYQTADSNYLKINRINVAFNCCIDNVKIHTSIDQDWVITVKETEICPQPCDCICLYDLEYTIGPLEYGTYLLQIVEEYADTMTVEFKFSGSTQGSYCELRDGYPWDVE